ncbi:MAG TPA: M23 family metallopeptidase [Cyclobacteriaceae bacterium]|nr:M23 family metallopeptidase [Cyclobacteriaceae bacterium]
MRLSNVALVCGLCISLFAHAQLSPEKNSASENPIDRSYLFPINPGQPNSLTGSMGELRNSHLHAGLDIRTNNSVGMPIRAAQRGYASYVVVSAHGYGNALFITHPDGNMSVYAHMDHFNGKVAEHILKKHYEQKSFELMFEIPKDLIPINQGDTIGFVGNTGGSEGPHLHFEIRDSSNLALNPLQFKFEEIKDGMAPVVQKIAFQTLDIDSRINGKFGRVEYFLMKRGNVYSLGMPLQVKGKIGIEVLAFDRMDYSNFRCGINNIEIFADSEKIFSQHIEKINFLDYDDIVTMMNYSTLKTRGLRFNKLYIEDGNPLSFYEKGIDKGLISVLDKSKNIQVSLKDTYGNESKVELQLIPEKQNNAVSISPISGSFDFEVNGDVLKLQVSPCAAKSKIVIYEKGAALALDPSYEANGQQVFLIDLKKMIPDSAQACNGMVRFNMADQIPSKTEYTFFSDWADIRFNKNSLYDTLYLNFERTVKNEKEVFAIGKVTEPLNDSINIELKQLKRDVNDPKVAVYHLGGRAKDFVGGRWENGNMKFSTRELGDFVLLKDSTPPYIQRIYCTSNNARFRISDNLSGIKKYEATINGEWLLMKYDYKTGALQSERLDKAIPLKGEFELKVTDRVGNEKVYRQKIL